MRITRARVVPLRLPLRAPLRTAHGVLRERSGALLALTTEDGRAGYGETLPLAAFGMETTERARSVLVELARSALGREPGELDQLLDEAEERAPEAPGARAAFDLALHDLAAREAHESVAALLAGRAGDRLLDGRAGARRFGGREGAPLLGGRQGALVAAAVPVSALLAGTAPGELADQARAALAQGFRTLKLKVGAGPLAADEARISAVREAAGAEPALRLDAGGGWSAAAAAEALPRLARFGIELVEEPIAGGDPEQLAALRAATGVALAADECLADQARAAKLLAARAVDWFVVKPAALGGLRAAVRIAAGARAAGVGVIATSFLDSALGVSGALHFALATLASRAEASRAPVAAGLATASLLGADLAVGPAPRGGVLALPAGAGLGVAPDPRQVEALRTGPAWEEQL